ncbi:MAG: TlpA family protein disulfide reductase [Bacteroidaceae bacterium]|nr:TlpA family protein disulfide reductase [Bacteroidaceae bacterium]
MKKYIITIIAAFCCIPMWAQNAMPKVGDKVPSFTVKDANGQEKSLDDLCEGKEYIMIDFWATWCVPCRQEMPNVKEQYAKYADKGFEVIGISEDRSKPTMDEFVEKEGIKWPVFRDQTKIAALYGVAMIPTTFIIDAHGVVVAKDLRGDDLGAKLAQLFP